jgi:hypothetical protein
LSSAARRPTRSITSIVRLGTTIWAAVSGLNLPIWRAATVYIGWIVYATAILKSVLVTTECTKYPAVAIHAIHERTEILTWRIWLSKYVYTECKTHFDNRREMH